MAKTPNTNTAQTAYPTYDTGSGPYPITPVDPGQATPVGNVAGLVNAINNASPGEVIEIVEPVVLSMTETLVVNAPRS